MFERAQFKRRDVLRHQKRQKQEKEFVNAMSKGDKIVTKSGMHGKIVELNDDGTCVVETMAGKIKFDRTAISMEMSKSANKVNKFC